jgi:amidase
VDASRAVFESLGCVVEEAEPDFAGVDDAFLTPRHALYHAAHAALARERPEWVKDTVRWEIAEAERRSGADVARARAAGADVPAERGVLLPPRLLRAPRDAGRPVRRDGAVLDRDRRRADGDLRRLDAELLVRLLHGQPGDLGPRRVHRGRAPRRHPDRRAAPRRVGVLQLAHAFEQATRYGERRPPVAARGG